MSTLRYLGRGWTFDDLEENTGICKDIHRLFFRQYIKYGKTALYPKFVKYPTNRLESQSHRKEYDITGMYGGIGFMDACHITVGKCPHRLK